MLHRVALVRTDVSEDLSASFIRMTRISALRTTLAVSSNRRTLRRNLLVIASVVTSSPILVTVMKEPLRSPETSVLTEPHGVTSQKTPFFNVYRCLQPGNAATFVASCVSIFLIRQFHCSVNSLVRFNGCRPCTWRFLEHAVSVFLEFADGSSRFHRRQ
jgi:hypothetical protein